VFTEEKKEGDLFFLFLLWRDMFYYHAVERYTMFISYAGCTEIEVFKG
jgi:hypothetical protein